ncbi:MAG TPA: hypothetical protein V6D25_07870 [Leptolyngbyaceae cyanobacterium]
MSSSVGVARTSTKLSDHRRHRLILWCAGCAWGAWGAIASHPQ